MQARSQETCVRLLIAPLTLIFKSVDRLMELQSSQTQYNPFGYILQNHQGIHKKNERGIALLSGSLLR